MITIILKELLSTIVNKEINFSSNKLKEDDKEVLIDLIEYIEDYLYVSEREKEGNVEYVKKNTVMDLISKYK